MAEGLSPQARGKPWYPDRLLDRKGPIPAGTGETAIEQHHRLLQKAYPRRHGGNFTALDGFCYVQGLSPQARGKRSKEILGHGYSGPIPAGTGETEQGSRVF